MRADLVGQLAVAQLAVEAAINELSRYGADSAALAPLRSQLTGLIGLRQSIATASGQTLAQLRAQVAATADAATASAQQAQSSANSGANGPTMTAQRARQAIAEVGHKLFDEQALDPYLQFSSPEDEAAYRKREEERRAAYEREMEKHTTAGDRRAAEIVNMQLADAKAHGAERSPQFGAMERDMQQATTVLMHPDNQAGVAAAARRSPTKAYDSQEEGELGDVLATLKAHGVSTDAKVAVANDGHGLPGGARGSGATVNLPSGRC